MKRWLYATTGVMAFATVVFVLDHPREEPPPLPSDSVHLAERLEQHPTDWRSASALGERALDSDDPRRLEEWRAAQALIMDLAPRFLTPRIGFIRSGLFHWYELEPADRRKVLLALGPLLRDGVMFERMAKPIFELTGDIGYLRSVRPDTMNAIELLLDLSSANGRFEDYRALRSELIAKRRREILSNLAAWQPSQIIAALPAHPTIDDEPVLAAVLRALHQRPLEVDSGRPDILDGVIDYAIRHRLGPLDGLAGVAREKGWASDYARGELARALGQNAAEAVAFSHERPPRGESTTINHVTWDGACGPAFCNRATADISGALPLTIEGVGGDEVPPYFECYVDDARVWEGPVSDRAKITLGGPGVHRVEIRLVNPLTRNRGGRRFRIL